MRQLLSFAQLVRLPNTFTAMADIFLGAIATGLLFGRWYVFLCLLASSTCLYWSGMIWNDYFDLQEDARDRPTRPLPSGRVTMRTAFVLALGFMFLGVLFAVAADFLNAYADEHSVMRLRAGPIAVLLAITILLYDCVLKESPIGPILMGMCRSFNVLLGLTILGTLPPFWGWLMAIIVGIYIGGITWFARTEAKRSSQPMLIGAAVAMLIGLTLALTIPALALEVSSATYEPSFLFPPLLALFMGYLGVAVLRAIRKPEPSHVQPAVKRGIMGLIVLDALLASAFAGHVGLLLAILLLPGVILGRWLYST